MTSHSIVHSAGELQQMRHAIRRSVNVDAISQFSPKIVHASGAAEFDRIAAIYLKSSANMQGDLPRFVDKMPINYLHIPIILKALPNAKIIHLVRDPMDSCFSSFKQLFAEAYFHSYTLDEMARHHVRYHRLMEHWRSVLPGRFLDVAYEDVVTDLEGNARHIIEYLELPWRSLAFIFIARNMRSQPRAQFRFAKKSTQDQLDDGVSMNSNWSQFTKFSVMRAF